MVYFRYFLHFDSHSGANDRHAECLAAKLYSLDDDLNFNNHHHPVHLSNCICRHVFPCPQQSNTYDCGMYVVECTRWLLNHSTIGVGDLDILEVDPTKIGQRMSSVVSHNMPYNAPCTSWILKCMPNVICSLAIGNPRVGIICTL